MNCSAVVFGHVQRTSSAAAVASKSNSPRAGVLDGIGAMLIGCSTLLPLSDAPAPRVRSRSNRPFQYRQTYGPCRRTEPPLRRIGPAWVVYDHSRRRETAEASLRRRP